MDQGAAGDRGTAGAVAVRRAALVTEISECSELQAMEQNLAGEYRLANSIDCTGFDAGDSGGFRPVGYGGSTLNPFTGIFDGQGFEITGLTIARSGTNLVGLFGLTDGAQIHHVGLEAVDMAGWNSVAPIVGVAIDTSISQVYATGAVSANNFPGGLCGDLKDGSTLVDSYTTVAVTSRGTSPIQGLVTPAMLFASATRTYSAGTFDSGNAVLVDFLLDSSITASFFDCTVAGNCSGSGAASTSAMQSESQYTTAGWDFDDVWVRASADRGHADRSIVDTRIGPSWTPRSVSWTARSPSWTPRSVSWTARSRIESETVT